MNTNSIIFLTVIIQVLLYFIVNQYTDMLMICVCNVSHGRYANYTYTAKYLEIHTRTYIILTHGVILVNGKLLRGGVRTTEAKFIVPDWGILSTSAIGLSYRPTSL
jgi:hypothetical protein